jgi:hypothetical protein
MIHHEMTIPDILAAHPQTLPVFQQFGIEPDGYKAIQYENLFATSRVHQLDLDVVLAALNRVLQPLES